MISTVLFDLGNVLVEFDPETIVRNFGQVVGMEPDEIHDIALAHLKTEFELGTITPAKFRDSISMALNCELTEEEFVPLWSDIFTVNEPMMEFFHKVRRTHRTYILSNTNAYHMDWILAKWPELRQADGMALSYELHIAKPDPAFYEAVIDLFGVTPSQCLYIDDSPENSKAGHAAGFHTILYETAEKTLAKIKPLLAPPKT
ncbi:MAG: HAD family phosphatase [Verrucomicrobia bacterium]|nr:HAD family phosphatase [Verrucomicrobiota bacterium]